jgi:hypothetical protein
MIWDPTRRACAAASSSARSERPVGRDRHLDRDLLEREPPHERSIGGSAQSVSDPLGAELIDRLPDASRAAELPRVDGHAQAGPAGPFEEPRKGLHARVAALIAGQIDTDDRARPPSLERRRHDLVKGFAELGFGYLIVFVLGAIVVAVVEAGVDPLGWISAGAALVVLTSELVIFLRSPYLRTSRPSPTRVRLR